MKENQALAEKTGNVLTQAMNDDGELVNLSKVDYDAIPDSDVVMEPSNNLIKEFMQHKNQTKDDGKD